MEKEFINYSQARSLKELGFNEPCIAFYNVRVLTFHTHGINPYFIFKKNSDLWDSCSAPLKQQVFRWFREKYNIDSHIEKYISSEDAIEYFCMVDENESINFETYEEAELMCIEFLIQLVQSTSNEG